MSALTSLTDARREQDAASSSRHDGANAMESIATALEDGSRASTVRPDGAAAIIDLRGFVEIARRRRAWIAATAAICVGMGLIYVLVTPARYVATTQLLLDPYGLQIVNNDLNPRSTQSEISLAEAESQVQVAISEVVLAKVVEREQLADDREFGNAGAGLLGRVVALVRSPPKDLDRSQKALRILQTHLEARRAEKTFVLNLSVWTEDANKSARIANALAEVYLEQESTAKADAALRVNASLVARLNELRQNVQESDSRVERYKAQNKIITATGQLVNEQQLSDMYKRLTLARERTAQQSARYAEIERLRRSKASPDAIAEVTDSGTFMALRTKYAEAKQTEANALTALGPRHPALQAARAQAEASRKLVDEEVARIAQSAFGDLERSRANEQAIESSIEALKQLTSQINESQVKLRELEREAESNRTVYMASLTRAKEVGEQRSLDKSNARIITHALPPSTKSNLPGLLILAGSLCVGLVGGFGLGLLREQFDPSIHSASQIIAEFGLAVLAVLPAQQHRRSLWSGRARRNADLAACMSYNPASEHGALVRRLREALLDSRPMNETRRVLITSFDGRWARSVVALNLARIAAADGERVLLIDSDPRQHLLTSSFAKADGAGFREVLEGRVGLSDVVVRLPWQRVDLLALGSTSSRNSARQLRRSSGDVISEQLRSFDLVVVDAHFPSSDPLIRSFSNTVDDVIIVVEAGVSCKDDLHRMLHVLASNKMNIRGAVLVGSIDQQG
jgi:polysaccharide biosynthesis transport protein